jgi:hypothetical protein
MRIDIGWLDLDPYRDYEIQILEEKITHKIEKCEEIFSFPVLGVLYRGLKTFL